MVWTVSHPWSYLGMVLSLSSMIAGWTGPTLRSVPLGSQRRKRALFCSLLGRSTRLTTAERLFFPMIKSPSR